MHDYIGHYPQVSEFPEGEFHPEDSQIVYTPQELLHVKRSLGVIITDLSLKAEDILMNRENRSDPPVTECRLGEFRGGAPDPISAKESFLEGISHSIGDKEMAALAEPIVCDGVLQGFLSYHYDSKLVTEEQRKVWGNRSSHGVETYSTIFSGLPEDRVFSEDLIKAGRALSVDLLKKLFDETEGLNTIEQTRKFLRDATFQRDTLMILIEGVDTIIRTLSFLLPEYPKQNPSQDALSIVEEISESGVINQLSQLFPMGLLAEWIRIGVFPRFRLSRDKDGNLVLDQRLVRVLSRIKRHNVAIEKRSPRITGMGCPAGEHQLELSYDDGTTLGPIDETSIDILSRIYVDYLRTMHKG